MAPVKSSSSRNMAWVSNRVAASSPAWALAFSAMASSCSMAWALAASSRARSAAGSPAVCRSTTALTR